MRARYAVWIVAAAIAVVSAACGETDAGITAAVKTKLATDDTVKAYKIDVDTSSKVVTLSGTVETAAAKTRAVEIARGTDGVANVIDNVTVMPATAAAPPMPDVDRVALTDPAITTAVKAKFAADTTVSALRIDVDTNAGIVTLTGQVRSQAEKDQALKLARETDAVKDVVDRLTVAP
jgi:osmotically-inducible protein OsmY